MSRSAALLLAAALAGASGLALEVILVDCAGLALGHGSSAALGLSTFLASWALGAQRAGRSRGSASRDLLRAGLVAGLLAWPAVRLVLWVGGAAPSGVLAALATIAAIACVGFAQGRFLAPLARAFRGEVSWLFAANFAGSVAGAYAIGDVVVGARGRLAAAVCAGVAAAAAGAIGSLAARGVVAGPEGRAAGVSRLSWRAAAWIVALATAWVVSLEWVGLRLGVLWLGGMQPALRAVLVASLASLALGAALVPRIVPRGPAGVLATLLLAALGGIWPFVAAPVIRAFSAESAHDLTIALVLVGPSILPFGGLIPVLHRALPLESGLRLGRLLLHEAWGALLGLPLVYFFLVPRFGLGGALALLELLGVAAVLALSRALPRAALAGVLLPPALCLWAFGRPPPALESPPLANPAFSVSSFDEDRDFAVTVVDDGLSGERTLLTDGFRAAGTGPSYRYMRVLGHLPILLSPHPRRVAVLALGTGTTLGAVSLHPEVERIDVLEISRAVVDAAPWFVEKNHGALGEERVDVVLGDGRTALARSPGAYDVITMEPLLPDSPFGVYLYTSEFYAHARAALAPDGLLCQWVPPHALEPASFEAVLGAFARAFPWSSVWLSGTQVILVGGERRPELDPARFSVAGPLAESLRELGLATPASTLGRFVCGGERFGSGERPLTDEDPWIVYRPRRAGAVLLGDLPANLARLRRMSEAPPEPWTSHRGPAVEALASLRAAREAHARAEARLRGFDDRCADAPDLAASLERAKRLAPDDPDVRDLEGEIRFLTELRAGVSLLASDRSREGAALALPHLVNAASWRRERGDVHLYAAIAFERLGEQAAARAAVAKALAICPGIARTSEGRRALELGLSSLAGAGKP
ncbi:MAG: spermidine synthase [Planctomycetota bacterium]